jgi:subtilisin family serine protease
MKLWTVQTLVVAVAAAAAMGGAAPQTGTPPTGPPYSARTGAMEFSGRLIAHVREAQGVPKGDAAARAAAVLQPYESQRIDEMDEFLITVPPGETEDTLGAKLWDTGQFDWVRPDWILYPAATPPVVPNDPLFPQQWHLAQVQAPEAWGIWTGSSAIIIAVVDTGVDVNHTDLTLVSGYDSHFLQRRAQANGGTVTDANGHGTMVAGAAASLGNNAVGGCGLGWNLRVMPIRATNPNTNTGAASFSDLQAGALWASNNGARIVNISFTGVAEPAVQALGATLRSRGLMLFWPMDDNNTDFGTTFDHPDVTVVSGTDQGDTRYGQSSYGQGVDLAVPAVSILTTTMGGDFGPGTGNSFASPIAAGAAAVVWGLAPTLSPSEVEQILIDSVDDIGDVGPDNFFGAGRLNLRTAVWLTVMRGACSSKQAGGYNAAAFGIDDLYEFTVRPLDVSGDGVIDDKDTLCVEAFLRSNENKDMTRDRP